MSSLNEQALAFAGVLSRLVNGTVSTGIEFEVKALPGTPALFIAPAGSEHVTRPMQIPLSIDGQDTALWLTAHFTAHLDDDGDHLSIASSKFALCLDKDTGNSLLRIEYERDRGREPDDDTRHKRPAAHVQILGSSTQLGFAQARAGSKYKQLEKVHFPVGGRRFRPSLEDFIEFLFYEGLLPGTHDGWRDVLRDTRGDYLARQLRAAVRREPDTAAGQLEAMGYTVQPPAR